MVGVTFDRRDRVRRPRDAGPPVGRVLGVVAHEVVVHELLAGRPRVGEAAGRQDALVDARVRVGDLLLRERAARAAGADRVADLAVLLDEPLLRHHHRLGLGGDVAVVPGVVQRGRHHGEAARQRRVVLDVRRGAGLVVDPAARAVGDQELVVEPVLRLPRRERLGRVVQDRDLVLVAVLVAGLDAHDVGNRLALVRGRRGDVGRRVVRVVVGERAAGGLVAVLVARRLVALRVGRRGLAHPRLHLRAGEHGAAVGVVRDGDARLARSLRTRGEHVGAERQAGDEAFEAPVRANGEGARHVAAVIEHADLVERRRRESSPPRAHHRRR